MTETSRLMCLNMWRLKPAGHIHKIQQLKLPFSCIVFFLPIKSKSLQKCFLWICSLHSIFLWCLSGCRRVEALLCWELEVRTTHQLIWGYSTKPHPHRIITSITTHHSIYQQLRLTTHHYQYISNNRTWLRYVCVVVIDYSTVKDLKIEQETEMWKRSYRVFQIFGALPK